MLRAHVTLGSPLSPEPLPVPDSLCSPPDHPPFPSQCLSGPAFPLSEWLFHHENGLAQGCCLPEVKAFAPDLSIVLGGTSFSSRVFKGAELGLGSGVASSESGRGALGEELTAASHFGEFLSGRVGLGPRPHGALTSPAAPWQKLDLERETIELVHTEPTDVAQLPSRVPRDAARYHFFLYKHTHEGDPLESVGEWPWRGSHCSSGWAGATLAHGWVGRLQGLWGQQECQALLSSPPHPPQCSSTPCPATSAFPVTGPQPLSSLRRAGNRASRPGHRALARSSLLRDCQEQGSLVGCRLWRRTESDTTDTT